MSHLRPTVVFSADFPPALIATAVRHCDHPSTGARSFRIQAESCDSAYLTAESSAELRLAAARLLVLADEWDADVVRSTMEPLGSVVAS
jgi:hypothetical protein